jgi:ceramide glucosyltransferase
VPTVPALLLETLAGLGILYTFAATALVGRWKAPAPATSNDAQPVTILKPLHGSEPALVANLQSFLEQDYPGVIQMVCGVQDPGSAAIDVVGALRDGSASVELCLDERRHGANGKISNLINMVMQSRHELLILSDSDIAAEPDYLRRIAAAIAAPGVGAVTCLYAGRGDSGGWSRLAAAGISYQFLPSVMVGLATRMAKPCMGSTIALQRETLDRIGGFARFADTLADDHAVGAAVRNLGLDVAVPPMLVTHGCSEKSLTELVRHELRWNVTVRRLDPLGFAGSIVTYPVPLALLALAMGGGSIAGALVVLALAIRMVLAARIDWLARRRTAPLWLLPVRDVLSFALFFASFLVRSVDWRGGRFRVGNDGLMSAGEEFHRS